MEVEEHDGFRVGGFYEDCAYHPVLCTAIRVEDGTVSLEGISLRDGSWPRSCDPAHCGPVPLTFEEAVAARLRDAR